VVGAFSFVILPEFAPQAVNLDSRYGVLSGIERLAAPKGLDTDVVLLNLVRFSREESLAQIRKEFFHA
jgi:hypothetical protein